MFRLGISIYPKAGSYERDIEYIKKAARLGYKRVFTCFLSSEFSNEELVEVMKKYSEEIHKCGMVLSVDTNPKIFEKLNVDPDNPVLFKEMGIDIVRLDGAFSVDKTIDFINNDLGLIVELNASCDLPINELNKRDINREQLITCHNFYPQRYTGLDESLFKEFSYPIYQAGLKIAAFVGSNEKDSFGPWPVSGGLVSIEETRGLSVSEQVRFIKSIGVVDDVFFANAYASNTELEELVSNNYDYKSVKIVLDERTSDEEKALIFDNVHQYRHDGNNYMIRSSLTRNTYIKPREYKYNFYPGDVVVINANQKHYQGEVEIILSEIENDGTKNYIGHLEKFERKISRNIKRSEKFMIIE